MTRVRLLQVEVNDTEPVIDRIERVLAETEEAAKDADFVVLPELWPAGAFDLPLGIEHAQSVDSSLGTALSEIANRTGTWLHAGSIVEQAGSEHFNTALLFDDNGELVTSYRKIHLFGFDGGEAELISEGSEIVVVDTPLGPTALATCYDLRFPELFRAFADRDAAVVLLSSGWPKARVQAWDALVPARAIENQCFVIGCNAAGSHAGVQLAGHSLVVDPLGEVLVEGNEAADVLTVDVDISVIATLRQEFPVLRDRRL